MKILDLRLYLVLDVTVCGGLRPALSVLEAALREGVTVVQLRCKDGYWSKRQWYEGALQVRNVLEGTSVPFLINDELDIAMAVYADGLHVGQDDLPVGVVREMLGEDKIIGLSTHNSQQVLDTPPEADYIGIGPVFPTQSKKNPEPVIGLESLPAVAHNRSCSAVAIGGITPNNAASVMRCGVDGVAVISAICAEHDPAAATRRLAAVVMGTHND